MEKQTESQQMIDAKENNKDNVVRHWKSLEEWQKDPEFLKAAENEFLSSPLGENPTPSARRDFLKLMGASIALSSVGCIRRPVQKIIPYVNRPKEIVMGVANYYTSTLLDGGEGFGVVVKTREGRPIKIDANNEHPANLTGASARAQSYILNLYDPDRLTSPKRNLHNEERTNRDTVSLKWEDADKEVVAQLKKGNVAVLTETLASPSTDDLISRFVRSFGGKHYVWDSIGADSVVEAHNLSYGHKAVPNYDISKADYIVSVGGDILGTHLTPTDFTRQWSANRDPDQKMNKMVVYEGMMSLTGANSDERFRVAPTEYLDVVVALIRTIVSKYAKQYKSRVDKLPAGNIDQGALKISEVADSLWQNRGKSLVVSGDLTSQTQDSLSLQIAVNFLNYILGNDGRTITGKMAPQTFKGASSDLNDLIARMKAGKVNTLIVHEANPAYFHLNPDFVEGLQKVGLVVYAGNMNETALVSDLVLPTHHNLENWGDSEIKAGVFSIQQPTIRPMHDTRAFQEMLMGWMKTAGRSVGADSWYDYVRSYWKRNILSGDFNRSWDQALQTGFVKKGSKAFGHSFRMSSLDKISKKSASSNQQIALYQKVGIGDGRLANVSWLQELPDPVTKIVWDNYVNVSPKTAKANGYSEGDIVKLTVNGKTIEAPVHIQPGVHDSVFAIAVGYGRWSAGKVGDGIGFNAHALTTLSGEPVKVEKTKKKIKIANTQGHHTMAGRPIVAETTWGEYKENPKAGHYKPHFKGTIWDKHKYPNHKWGMVIDTNSCTGCSSCVIACQSENNIPVVGKKYVLEGREMHWLRIDRYYSENPDNPETVHQPLACQHCDNAPCETVCPVVATSHSSEGLNEMTYNRCVGTRYCANNCPYKVRRFNWFSFLEYRKPQEMALNPEVQVRSRGVMEKCTFCVQKIKEAKNIAKDEKRELRDGDIKTACQVSCPVDAISFGDTNDPNSKVSLAMKKKRGYTLLPDLNAQPAVTYLTKIRHRDKREGESGGGH